MTTNPITVDAYALRAAVDKLKPAVAARAGSLPILAGVRLTPLGRGRLELLGTDLELTISTVIEMGGRKGPSFVLPFLRLADVLADVKKPAKATKRNPDPEPAPTLTIEQFDGPKGEGMVRLSYGLRTVEIEALPADEFPRIESNVDKGHIKGTLAPLVDVAFAASRDDFRPILTGVLASSGASVATDSYRLAVNESMPDLGPEAPGGGLLIPARAITAAAKLGGEPVLSWSERSARWTWDDDSTVTCRLIEGEFPNWRGLVGKADDAQPVEFPDLSSLRRALTALRRSAAGFSPVRLEHDGTDAALAVRNLDGDSDRIAMPGTSGEPITTAWNPTYFGSCLVNLEGPTCTIEAHPVKPSVIREGDRMRLIMPVRIS